jgi:hypothetical protein
MVTNVLRKAAPDTALRLTAGRKSEKEYLPTKVARL